MKEQIKADLPFSMLAKEPRTPADWKAGYEAAVKAEQARHAEAMGEKAQGRERNER